MTTTGLDEFLASREADADTIQQAMRSWVLRRTDFMSPEAMRVELAAAVGSDAAVAEALAALQRDAGLLESVSLAVLSDAWGSPPEAERIARAVDDAKTKMPVIEVGIMAMVAMYGMYLAATRGKKSEEWIVQRDEQGRLQKVRRTSYFGPTGPLSALGGMISGVLERDRTANEVAKQEGGDG
jgi:hypothetical protein